MILALVAAGEATVLAAETMPPLSSTKDRGLVSIVTDPALSQGRLVLKVVAFNRTREPAAFSDADVKIVTAAGKPVAFVPVDQLIAEVTKPAGRKRRVSSGDHNPADYSHPQMATGTSGAGEPDVSGYTGGGNPTSGVVSAHTDVAAKASSADAQQNDQVAALRAGILHSMIIPSATAAGGQLVSEKLKFTRKEERRLRVTVEFNGEQHEFSVVPPAQ
jgi:hypothetical protein